jgi:hypothetical protein
MQINYNNCQSGGGIKKDRDFDSINMSLIVLMVVVAMMILYQLV